MSHTHTLTRDQLLQPECLLSVEHDERMAPTLHQYVVFLTKVVGRKVLSLSFYPYSLFTLRPQSLFVLCAVFKDEYEWGECMMSVTLTALLLYLRLTVPQKIKIPMTSKVPMTDGA